MRILIGNPKGEELMGEEFTEEEWDKLMKADGTLPILMSREEREELIELLKKAVRVYGKDGYKKEVERRLRERKEFLKSKEEKEEKWINCPHCGHPLPSEYKFCNQCGESVKKAEENPEKELDQAREEAEEAFEKPEEEEK